MEDESNAELIILTEVSQGVLSPEVFPLNVALALCSTYAQQIELSGTMVLTALSFLFCLFVINLNHY